MMIVYISIFPMNSIVNSGNMCLFSNLHFKYAAVVFVIAIKKTFKRGLAGAISRVFIGFKYFILINS